MTRLLALASLISLTACASLGRSSSTPAADFGQYRLSGMHNGMAFRGVMSVARDAITLSINDSVCRPEPLEQSRVSITFQCGIIGAFGEANVEVNRLHPSRKLTLSGTGSRVASQSACYSVAGPACAKSSVATEASYGIRVPLVATPVDQLVAR